ncbi:MAG: DUF4435 domain-containing protein [Bacteroidaceae bacterium]|nr:DUF4435 domain-containing protein [Bacteroidaceae bacterium]
MKRLVEYLNSGFIEAANALRPKGSKVRIVAYVESYDDVSFWRSVFDEYESDKFHFEILLPARKSLTKGKKRAMMNMLGQGVGKNMIACVDSDYDFLMQGATSSSRELLNNKYVLHTYAYAIENFKCYSASLKRVCVQSTLNDTDVLDFETYMQLYSRICYPLFLWNILLYRNHDLKTMSMQRFCEIVRITSFTLSSPEHSLKQLAMRVEHEISILNKRFPNLLSQYESIKKEFAALGISDDETYMYIQGHHMMNSVVLRILIPICRYLRNKRETDIQRLACHRQQMDNELSSYRHSQCDVALMLSKNTNYKDAKQYKWLKRDIEELLLSIEADLRNR